MAKRAELFKESAHGTKALLFKKNNVVNVRIARKNIVGCRLDNPRQMRFGIRLLNRIGHGERMNDVADGAEFDNQDVVHDAPPPLPYFRLILSMIFVVERPGTRPMKCTSPPYLSTIFASGSVSRV